MLNRDSCGFYSNFNMGFRNQAGSAVCGFSGFAGRDAEGFFKGAPTSQPYMAASGGRMCPCAGCGHINIDADPFTGMGQLACARCCKRQQAGFRSASGVRPCIEHGFARCSGRGTYMQCRNRCTSKPSPKVGQFKGACGCGG